MRKQFIRRGDVGLRVGGSMKGIMRPPSTDAGVELSLPRIGIRDNVMTGQVVIRNLPSGRRPHKFYAKDADMIATKAIFCWNFPAPPHGTDHLDTGLSRSLPFEAVWASR